MTQEEIQQLFRERYNQAQWRRFLGETFAQAQLLANPEELTGFQNDSVKRVLKLGSITLSEDGIERNISIFEVALGKGVVLERNRVGLRNLLRKYWKHIDGAFIVYHNPDNNKWRFTYVSELTGYDAEGNYQKVQTEPKRYTYVCGEGESTRTAAERFVLLARKGNRATLEDVKEAFSVEKLSDSFFDGYKNIYKGLCDYMIADAQVKRNVFGGDEKAIRDFNKKFLGRIVFLYFLQKKGWMGVPPKEKYGLGDVHFLQNQFENFRNKDRFYKDFLTVLFFETLNTHRKDDIFNYDNRLFVSANSQVKIPFLSGGLFDEEDVRQRDITIPADMMRNIIEFFNQYNFTIYEDDPNDHTVAVDPEMLGHIFENLLEDNKDKGTFYTPKEIVHYMCQESLIEYLCTWYNSQGYEVIDRKDKEPKQQSKSKGKSLERTFVERLMHKKLEDEDAATIKMHAPELHQALDTVKICDPAIGSGAFPMGLLQEIYATKQHIWFHEHGSLEHFPASDIKQNIIQHSIYGVDIEKGAVDIARLRFWLSLVVDEEEPKALPNLDYKIVVGNSLLSKLNDEVIDIDWNASEAEHGLFGASFAEKQGKLLKQISQEQRSFFDPNSNKKKHAKNIRSLKIDLLVNQLELMIENKGVHTKPSGNSKKLSEQQEMYYKTLAWKDSVKELKKLKDQPDTPLKFFDWKLDFPEVLNDMVNPNLGFDIVIGNPPYVQLQKMGKETDGLQQVGFETFTRTGDIYCLFYEKGFDLLKKGGTLTYITSNKWMRGGYGRLLRNFFTKVNTKKILNLGPGIFRSATVDTNIYLGKNESFDNLVKGISIEKRLDISILKEDEFIPMLEVNDDAWVILDEDDLKIRRAFEKYGKPLRDWDIEIYRGVLTGFNEAFIIDQDKRNELVAEDPKATEIIRPILKGREIERYYAEWSKDFIINTHNGYKDEFGQIIAHINVRKDLPSIWNYLQKMELELIEKRKIDSKIKLISERADMGWHWSNLRNCAYLNEFKKEKVIWKRIGSIMRFAYSDEEMYCLDSTCIATGEKIKYLTAILNSKAGLFQLFKTSPQTGTGDQIISVQALEPLLVHYPSDEVEIKFNLLVDYILFVKKSKVSLFKHLTNEQVSGCFEELVDMMVYELYFEEEMKTKELDVIRFVTEEAFPDIAHIKDKRNTIMKVFSFLQEEDNPIRRRILEANKRSEIIARINETVH